MHGWAITCGKCGESSDTGLWVETLLGQKRPKEHYQCPACGVAFVRESAPPTVRHIGDEVLLLPGDVTITEIPAVHKYETGNVLPLRKRS